MRISILSILLLVILACQAYDNVHHYELQNLRRVKLNISSITDNYRLNSEWFENKIAFYLKEDDFITLNRRSKDVLSISLVNYDVREMETVYFNFRMALTRQGKQIWNKSCYGFVRIDEQQELIRRKLEHFLNTFYYQYLIVNNLKKESKKKIDEYSQWYRTKVFSRGNAHRNWYFPEERPKNTFY